MEYQTETRRKLYRSGDAVLFGVCGGIGEYFDLPPWGVRLVFVLLTIIGFPFMFVGYIIAAMLLKKRPGIAFGPEEERLYAAGEYQPTHAESLRRLKQRFEALDKRLQRMESIVTRPTFDLEREYRDL